MRNKRSRKAEISLALLIGIILTLLGAAIFLYYEYKIKTTAQPIIKKEICKQSVFQNGHRLRFMGTDLTDKFGNKADLLCSTDYTTIKDKDDDMIKFRMADAMFDCYDQFHQGTLPVFDVDDQNFCVICSVLDFKEEKQISGFSEFLMTTRIPSLSTDKTFFEFFYKTYGADFLTVRRADKTHENYDLISTENDLAVVFVMAKEGHLGQAEGAFTGTLLGGTAGGVAAVVLLATGVIAPVTLPVTIGAVALLGGTGAVAGGGAGMIVGSPVSTNWDAGIMITPIQNVDSIPCTWLEGHPNEGLSVYK